MKALTLITANSGDAPHARRNPICCRRIQTLYSFPITILARKVLLSGGHVCSSTGLIKGVKSQSSQLFSTVSFTRLVYSLRLSLYRFEASTLAGDEVFGSLSRLHHGQESAEDSESVIFVGFIEWHPYL